MSTIAEKVLKFVIALLVLSFIGRRFSFKYAVLVGLAMNSADINEARELVANSTND